MKGRLEVLIVEWWVQSEIGEGRDEGDAIM